MIFCIEDEESIRDLMIYTLNGAGFDAKGFSDGKGFFEALQQERPRLILLDIMLPGEDGISILKRLRSKEETAGIPVMMATAKGTEYDKVMGLDLGADDYLVKPFGMMEMISRIRAVLRRTEAGYKDKGKILQMGALELNPETYAVSADGERVQLTLKEHKLLRILMENPKRVFTRDQLLESVWGIEYAGETRTVDVHVATLRTKLGQCGSYIETVRGVGYRIGGDV
ncbi:MAG: response regulator transcription factor [Lachnospiraceae bacterium]|jgi:two-component system alkaline phosphatase synthesis response regulator PhoP|nr:response regulator transcription factor [Lachnospiraceae bacterium]MCI9342965.1 response regulator transcription factor [Lachnospiraceae bacterium]GFH90374.1 sensory transduction protein regX3 [Lachnospiraceae bacterium]